MGTREDSSRREIRYARDRREGRKERRRMDIEGKTRGDVENESGTGLG